MALLFFMLLFARRYEQLLDPQVWDEDGTVVVHDLIVTGPASLFKPIAGYLISVPRLISAASLSLSFVHYPLISTLLAWAFIVGVALAIALSPSIVRGGPFLAAAALLVPSNAEVFGLPLYTFWWAALLIFVAALWQPGRGGLWWRVAFVLIGGLSSPAIFLAVPIFVLRPLLVRVRDEFVVSGVALVCAAIQFYFVRQGGDAAASAVAASLSHAPQIVSKFLGFYFAGNLVPWNDTLFTIGGFAVAAVIVVTIVLDRKNAALYALCYLWLGSIALTAARVDVAILQPNAGGPRYFFYAYVFLGWLLVEIAYVARPLWLRRTATVLLLLAAANTLPVLSRTHDDLHWAAAVDACARAPGSTPSDFPIHYNGDAKLAWHMTLTGDQCRAQLRRSLLDGAERRTFALVGRKADGP